MPNEKPKLLVISGPNGSGKTSITTQILKHEWVEGCIYDNSKDFAPAKLLFRVSNGILGKQYKEINPWATPILESISPHGHHAGSV